MIAMEVMELFTALESNHPQEVEDVKHKFHEQFNNTREPWLLNGMYDYFMTTGSQRAVEVLVAVREPHDKHLFDRLLDGLRSANRLQALTLLGHVVKRQPTWLIKITNHYLLKELIKLLKSENEIITITSALLVLNVLLTVIPALIASYLPDIFEGFSRLAAWNTSQKNKVPELHLFHLQISLYVLFVQLYSMYPCSFVLFLKQQYSSPDNHLVFTHTIKPMVETMRMHPSLIVSCKDVETSTSRWKKMEQHDVVMECTRYTLLENGDKNYQNSSTWPNVGSNFSSALEKLKSSIGASGDIISVNSIRDKELWSPMLCSGEFYKDNVKSMPTTPNIQTYYNSLFNHNEHSPPEAAVEATPETTPIRDVIYQQSRLPSLNSTVVRALNSFGLENLSKRNSSTPNSQPSSPLKKEGFFFPSEDIQSQAIVRRMDKMIMERNQIADSSKDENNVRTESKPIAAQIQQTNNPEIIQTGDEDIIECDQQSNGSPCQTYEGGLHMPDPTSLKDFVKSVRTRRRYYSQCTPEKTINVTGQSTGSSPRKGTDFLLLSNVRRTNSCPEIKKTNGSSISSGTSPLQEETEEDHGDDIHFSNGHTSEIPNKNAKVDNHVTNVQTASTQTEHILPYEHLFYSIFPAYNDPNSSVKNQQNSLNSQEDESLCLIEKYVRTSAIVLKHRHTAESTDDIKLLQDQISLLTLQLQFERNRREVHAERNRRLLGKSRSSRALDEHNSALKDQVAMLQVELEHVTSGFEKFRQNSFKQVKDLKDSVSHWQNECLKYQEETKEAKNNCLTLDELYNGEKIKTAEVTKQLSETKAELFNTLSELSIVQATADISKELKNTVANMQRELVMCGEMQSRQRDVVTHINALRYEATNAMLSQESYRHHIQELQDMAYQKSALLEASNARIADLELQLNNRNTCILNDKCEIEMIKEQYNKKLSEVKEECRILREIQCRYVENKEEEESKKRFLEELPKFTSDMVVVDSNTSINDQDADFRLSMMLADDGNYDDAPVMTTTPK